MNRLRRNLLLGGLLLILLTWLAGSASRQLQSYQQRIDHGASPEASANEYLAAELFLRARGLDVSQRESLGDLRRLPGPGQSLLLFASREQLSPRQTRQLLDWAASGGHLLFVAEDYWDAERGASDDALLDALDIRQSASEALDTAESDTPADDSDSPASSAENTPELEALTQIWLEDEPAPAYAGFDTRFHLEDHGNRAHAWANSGKATHMLQLEHGEGLITVLTDAWLWHNDRIRLHDNAWLLWYLTQDSAVTLISNSPHEDLLSLLLKHYPQTLVILALLIGLGLWHAGMRHGAPIAAAAPARRQLQEHLRASADFLLRHAGQRHLLQALQRDIQRRARQRQPGFERLPVAEQWQALARLSRLPGSAISAAMRPLASQRLSASDFTRQVAHLQTLRNAL